MHFYSLAQNQLGMFIADKDSFLAWDFFVNTIQDFKSFFSSARVEKENKIIHLGEWERKSSVRTKRI
jgi:hypothetical protein